jgi:hypothetical protein
VLLEIEAILEGPHENGRALIKAKLRGLVLARLRGCAMPTNTAGIRCAARQWARRDSDAEGRGWKMGRTDEAHES